MRYLFWVDNYLNSDNLIRVSRAATDAIPKKK